MKIIDFERKGNVIRFYLGEYTEEWGWTNPNYKDFNKDTPIWFKKSETYYGDDWNDNPYECNAGKVYDEFIKDYYDLVIPFNKDVIEPQDDVSVSKNDMVARKVPCIIVVPNYRWASFSDLLDQPDTIKIFFGDDVSVLKKLND